MALHLIAPVVFDTLSVDDVVACALIKEAGGWLQLVGAMLNLNAYLLRSF